MKGKTISEIKVGDVAEATKTVSETDVYLFAGVTGDFNPAHMNETFDQNTFFISRIDHGLLGACFISAVVGMQLPGPGTIYITQELKFLAPTRIGDTVTARVEVLEVIADKKRVRLKTECVNQEGKVILAGEAVGSPPRE